MHNNLRQIICKNEYKVKMKYFGNVADLRGKNWLAFNEPLLTMKSVLVSQKYGAVKALSTFSKRVKEIII